MSLESFNYIDSLNASNPTTTDNVSEGDDHIRGIKTTIKNTFPNINAAVTATDEELNYVDGVTSNIQTQLGTKLPLAGGTMTGTIAGFTSTGIDDNATSTKITVADTGVAFGTDIELGTFSGTGATTGIATAMTSEPRIHTSGTSTAASDVFKFYTPNGEVGKIQTSGTGTLYNTGTSGGIDFSATSDGSGTMTSEVLDDYEEGTCTLTMTFTGTGAVYNSNTATGYYTKVGNLVTVVGLPAMNWSNQGTYVAGNTNHAVEVSGLPFTLGGGTNQRSAPTIGQSSSIKELGGTIRGHGNSSGTSFNVFLSNDTGSTRVSPDFNASNTQIHMSFTYIVA
jgi:hypothetical protein